MKLLIVVGAGVAAAVLLRRWRASTNDEHSAHAVAEAMPRRGPGEAEAESATRPREVTRYDELREAEEQRRHDAARRLAADAPRQA